MNERFSLSTENGEKGLIPVKGLRLITPQQAIELGVETEAPIFVSRSTSGKQLCCQCKIEFSALVYDVGAITKSQHLHGSRFEGGGIYYELLRPDNLRSVNIFGWIALVTPSGTIVVDDEYEIPCARAESVVTSEIIAGCMNRSCQGTVDEGVAALIPTWVNLFAYHEKCLPEQAAFQFYFKIQEGRPLFSQI